MLIFVFVYLLKYGQNNFCEFFKKK